MSGLLRRRKVERWQFRVESLGAMKELLVVNLGLVEYSAAWEMQRRVAAARTGR